MASFLEYRQYHLPSGKPIYLLENPRPVPEAMSTSGQHETLEKHELRPFNGQCRNNFFGNSKFLVLVKL
jgi:hypothetical protein